LDTVKKFGLSRPERLKGKQVTKELFLSGKRFHRGNLTIIYLPSDKQMAGFVASKKIGGVVIRNRTKRILREAYRMNKEIFKGLKIVFYAQGFLKFGDAVDIFCAFREGR